MISKNQIIFGIRIRSKKGIHHTHSEILGSYLQQPHQHQLSRAHFEAEPHSQAEANKWQPIFCLFSRTKLTDSLVTGNTSLPCSARWTEDSGVQAGINAWSELLWKYSMIFFAFVGITCCGSASLKRCVCDAAYPWSQSPSPHSQCTL